MKYALMVDVEAESPGHAAEWLDQAIGCYVGEALVQVMEANAKQDDFAAKLFRMVSDHANEVRRSIRPVPEHST